VSSKKDKLIEEAQRLLLRGQLDKAIRAYEQVLSLDPSAINQRQKLAELLVKAGRAEDARAEFEIIGKHYSSNGFYLKAIAVYKQLQKLFPGDIAITMTLAELNEKHGLLGNALAEYKQVYDYYEKDSDMEKAIKILDRMQNVAPQNINIKLKLAESYYQTGKMEESYAAFGRLASFIQERGDNAAFSKLNARIQQLFPDKADFMRDVLAEQVKSGNVASAVTGIQSLLRNNPNDKRNWDLIVTAYKKLNQLQRVKVAYQHYLKFFPGELSVKRGLLECLLNEKDIKRALLLLDHYDHDFIDAGAAADLVDIYKGLYEIEPLNARVLEGLKRLYEEIGDKENAEALEPKLSSLNAYSSKHIEEESSKITQVVGEAETNNFDEIESSSPDTHESSEDAALLSESADVMLSEETIPELEDVFTSAESDAFTDTANSLFPAEEGIEIEIEIDEDTGFEGVGTEVLPGASGDNWLNSVAAIFDTIATSPRGVKFGSDLDTSDAQSHFDLGVAFKEMGLFDDAINEFRQAAVDSCRTVECLVLQGACLREKGDLGNAENFLRSLVNSSMGLEDSCSVKYELILVCEVLGKRDEATALLKEIDTDYPGFRDVRSRLDAADVDNSLDFSDEDLQGFDLK
jgi:tetratricopeptide (TPR) repeat protein